MSRRQGRLRSSLARHGVSHAGVPRSGLSRYGLFRYRRARAGRVTDTRVFISGVRSRSHLVYASAYLRNLLRRKGVGQVTVVNLGLGAFLGVEAVTPDDVARSLPAGRQISIEHADGSASWGAKPGEALIYLAVGAPGIKPYLRLLLANRSRLHRVVVDEGLGSYGSWRTRWAAGRRQGGRGPHALVRAVAVASAQRYFTDERWALYRRTRAGWQPDCRIASEFRAQLAPAAAPGSNGTAVLVSQPWVELGQLSAERYLAIVAEVERACTEAGLALALRPHPAEDRTRYAGLLLGAGVDGGRGPAELDRAVVDAATVLGFNSTALINLSAVHGTRVLRLAIPELGAVEAGLSTGQRSLLDAFVGSPVPLAALADRLREGLARNGRRGAGSAWAVERTGPPGLVLPSPAAPEDVVLAATYGASTPRRVS